MKISTGWTIYGLIVSCVIWAVIFHIADKNAEKTLQPPTVMTGGITTSTMSIIWTGSVWEFTCSWFPDGGWTGSIRTSLIDPIEKQLGDIRSAGDKIPYTNWPKDYVMVGRFVREYCATDDGKYIVISNDKTPDTFSRFDAKLWRLEVSKLQWQSQNFIPRWRSLGKGFWKRVGNTIGYEVLDVPFGGYIKESDQKILLKHKNFSFCTNGLLSNGKWADCSYDVYYEYNFIENVVHEKKICTFYVDENGVRKTLESCRIF